MNIILHRTKYTQYGIDGYLSIDMQKICDTAENPEIHLEPGTYPVTIHHCHHYRRKMPVVRIGENALPCVSCKRHHIGSQHANLPIYCPQIKIGNGVMNRKDGSIIIGDLRISGLILNSSNHFDRLIDRLDKAQNRGDRITLTIQ